MSNWHRPDVETSVLDALTKTHGPISARQMVDGLIAKGRAQAEGDTVYADHPDDTYSTTRGEPGDDEPDSPAAQAAREIQALHDPTVCGYIIGTGHLRLILHPTEWQQWQDWQKRLWCPVGQTTYRGGTATAHGKWGQVPVVAVCHLDRLPKATEPGDGA